MSDTERIRWSLVWLNLERAARIGVGVVQVAVVARYLGAEQYGELNIALAVSAILAGPAALGLDTVMVRWLVATPAVGGSGLATAVFLRVIAGCLAALGAAGAAAVLGGGAQLQLVAIAAITCIAQAPLVLETWFRSQVLARPAVLARLAGFFGAFGLRLGLVGLHAPVAWFAVVAVLEIGISGVVMYRGYRRCGGPALRGLSANLAADLLRESWPVAVGSIAAVFMTKIDLLVLQGLAGVREAGIYSAAVRLVELPFFLSAAVAAAFTPRLVDLHHRDRPGFEQKFAELVSLLTWTGAGIALVWFLLGPFLIRIVFGPGYGGTAAVVRAYAWNTIPVNVAVAWGVFWLAERRQLTVVGLALFGGLVAVGLCYSLIPALGARGAALAAIAAQAAPFLLVAAMPDCRGALRASTRGILNPTLGFRMIGEVFLPGR